MSSVIQWQSGAPGSYVAILTRCFEDMEVVLEGQVERNFSSASAAGFLRILGDLPAKFRVLLSIHMGQYCLEDSPHIEIF